MSNLLKYTINEFTAVRNIQCDVCKKIQQVGIHYIYDNTGCGGSICMECIETKIRCCLTTENNTPLHKIDSYCATDDEFGNHKS